MNTPEPSREPRKTLITAGGITSAGFAASQFARLLGNLILTRLLVPEVFGVMAIASTILTGFSMLSDTGIKQYIFVSKEGLNKSVLNTAWTMQIIRGILICLLMVTLATALNLSSSWGLIGGSSAYSHPILPYVIAFLAICPVLNGFQSTKRFELNRKLAMGYIVVVDVCCQLIGLVFMVLLAWIYESIWALVAGNIFTCLIRSISTHVFFPGQSNSLHWNQEDFHKIFSFSFWIFISSVLGYLVNHTDWLWLGALITAEKLGIYSIGKHLAFVVYNLVNKLSVAVVLPELSNVARERPEEFSKSYYRMRMFIDIPAFLVAGILFMSGSVVIEFLYDPRYYQAGEILEILSLLLLSAGYMQATRCMVALGLVRQRAMITAINALTLNIAIFIFYFSIGFNGVLYAMVLSPIVPILLLNYYLYKRHIFNLFYEIRFLPLFLLGLLIGRAVNEILSGVF